MTTETPATEPLDLEAIRARTDVATKGPWRVVEEHGYDISDEAWSRITIQSEADDRREVAELIEHLGMLGSDGVDRDDENAEFIAHAREDVPRLLDEVEQLRALVATCSCATGPAFEGPQADCPVHGAVRAFNEASRELVEARAEIEEDRRRRAAEAEAQRQKPDVVDALTVRARQAGAERDAMRPVVEKVRAWREARPGPWTGGTDAEFHLQAAWDAYTAGQTGVDSGTVEAEPERWIHPGEIASPTRGCCQAGAEAFPGPCPWHKPVPYATGRPAQDAARGTADPAEGGAPRDAEGWRQKCCQEFAHTGITHTEACWAEDGADA